MPVVGRRMDPAGKEAGGGSRGTDFALHRRHHLFLDQRQTGGTGHDPLSTAGGHGPGEGEEGEGERRTTERAGSGCEGGGKTGRRLPLFPRGQRGGGGSQGWRSEEKGGYGTGQSGTAPLRRDGPLHTRRGGGDTGIDRRSNGCRE